MQTSICESQRSISRGRRLAAFLGSFAACMFFAGLGDSNTRAQSPQSVKSIRFDVVSIRPTPKDADPYNGGGWVKSSDGYHFRIMPLYGLIMNAYFQGFDRTPNPIKNAPPWLQERFDVEAKVAPEDVPEWSSKTLSSTQSTEMVQGALQAMLADRLKLVAHREPVTVWL